VIVIEITRALARRFRAVLRKSFPNGHRLFAPLIVQSDNDGLRIRAADTEVAVEYHQVGKLTNDCVRLPADALADFEGGKEETVTLETIGPQGMQAHWTEGSVPQLRAYTINDKNEALAFPALPERWYRQERSLLEALREATTSTAKEGTRYALQRVQLRGAKGEIVATDGHQLLIQRGFSFPWTEDVLVPALRSFGIKEIAEEPSVSVGKTETHVGVRIGPWTFLLTVDGKSRFPRVEDVIPRSTGTITTIRLDAQDASFLTRSLPRLPGGEENNSPLTLDLNGHVAVRARGEDPERVTELILSRSAVGGPPLRLVTNRAYLARAAALGFEQIDVLKPEAPLVCRDEKRTYVWMPLDKAGALAASPEAVRIESTSEVPVAHGKKQERRKSTVNPISHNGNAHEPTPRKRTAATATDTTATPSTEIATSGLIGEAQALRSLLRDALARLNQLLIAAKQQRKQSQLLRTTLATLKQLQSVQA
jgi:hypothetical protein